MTNLHTADVNRRLTEYLDRRAPPRSFSANEAAKADQITAYLAILTRAAPAAPALDDWWGKFLNALSEASETWAWPSEKEIRNACKAATGHVRGTSPGDAWKPDAVEINAQRVRAGEPVGDDFVWGAGALKLLDAGVTRDQLMPYRRGSVKRLIDFYGDTDGRRRVEDLRARYERAKREHLNARDSRPAQRFDVDRYIPDKTAFSAQEIEAMAELW